MSGYHFFAEINGGQWHRTEDKGTPGGTPVKCSCGISNQDSRVLKLRGHDDDSWKWCPPGGVAPCFPEEMRNPKEPERKRLPTDHDGVPMCSHAVCPKYNAYSGKCSELVGMPTDVCIPEVRDMALNLDAHEDASTPAFDEIAKLCGVPEWEYPGQVIRDVQLVVKQRDELRGLEAKRIALIDRQSARLGELITERDTARLEAKALDEDMDQLLTTNKGLKTWLDGMRDERDRFRQQADMATEDYRIQSKTVEELIVERDLWKGRATTEWSKGPYADLQRELNNEQAERTKDLHLVSRQGELIEEQRIERNRLLDKLGELRESLRFAEAVRDDARTASQKYLGEKREALQCRDQLQRMLDRSEALRTERPTTDEIGALRSQVTFLSDEQVRLIKEREDMRLMLANEQRLVAATANDRDKASTQKDDAYAERDRCVAGLAALAIRLGWRAWLGLHEDDPKWDREWMTIVFISTPAGQVSWHIHDREVEWFSFLPTLADGTWDGHTTPQKYERLASLSRDAMTAPYVGCPDCGTNIDHHLRPLRARIAELEAELQSEKLSAAALEEAREAFAQSMQARLGGRMVAMRSPESPAQLEASLSDNIDGGKCACSSKYLELAPGVHAKYCPLAGLPLSDGRQRWTCNACKIIWRAADGETTPVDRCISCGGSTIAVTP